MLDTASVVILYAIWFPLAFAFAWFLLKKSS